MNIKKILAVTFGFLLFAILWQLLSILNFEFFENMDKVQIIRKLFLLTRKEDSYLTFELSGGFTFVSLIIIFFYPRLFVKLLFILIELSIMYVCFRFKQSDWNNFAPLMYSCYIGLVSFFGVSYMRLLFYGTKTESTNFNIISFWKFLKSKYFQKEISENSNISKRNILEIPETELSGKEIFELTEKGFTQVEISKRTGMKEPNISKLKIKYLEELKQTNLNENLKVA